MDYWDNHDYLQRVLMHTNPSKFILPFHPILYTADVWLSNFNFKKTSKIPAALLFIVNRFR